MELCINVPQIIANFFLYNDACNVEVNSCNRWGTLVKYIEPAFFLLGSLFIRKKWYENNWFGFDLCQVS